MSNNTVIINDKLINTINNKGFTVNKITTILEFPKNSLHTPIRTKIINIETLEKICKFLDIKVFDCIDPSKNDNNVYTLINTNELVVIIDSQKTTIQKVSEQLGKNSDYLHNIILSSIHKISKLDYIHLCDILNIDINRLCIYDTVRFFNNKYYQTQYDQIHYSLKSKNLYKSNKVTFHGLNFSKFCDTHGIVTSKLSRAIFRPDDFISICCKENKIEYDDLKTLYEYLNIHELNNNFYFNDGDTHYIDVYGKELFDSIVDSKNNINTILSNTIYSRYWFGEMLSKNKIVNTLLLYICNIIKRDPKEFIISNDKVNNSINEINENIVMNTPNDDVYIKIPKCVLYEIQHSIKKLKKRCNEQQKTIDYLQKYVDNICESTNKN